MTNAMIVLNAFIFFLHGYLNLLKDYPFDYEILMLFAFIQYACLFVGMFITLYLSHRTTALHYSFVWLLFYVLITMALLLHAKHWQMIFFWRQARYLYLGAILYMWLFKRKKSLKKIKGDRLFALSPFLITKKG